MRIGNIVTRESRSLSKTYEHDRLREGALPSPVLRARTREWGHNKGYEMRQILAGGAIVALAVGCSVPAYAQETTSSITGTVTAGGRPVGNATVTIVHVPSGTRTTATSNASGTYVASGLRAGGPYTVTVSAPGYENMQVTDVATNVGQTFQLPLALESTGNEIVVTATHVKGARSISQGPAMVLNANQIGKVASVNRDIRDLMQRDPFATLDSSQSTGRQVSFAGVNPRFNRFTVDGVPITDSFGLNPDALPSRRGPVPLDSIGQFETKVAPYDIREGFFQGGVINAILKSGTNQFHGTGFFTYSSDKLQGDRTKDYITNATGKITVPKYNSKDFGATISGPIIKDRLFFMISGERVRASLPVPYGTLENNAGAPISGLTQADFDAITAAAKSRYGVDAGGILSNNGDKDDRVVGKLDANISETQRLSLTGIYTKDSILTPGTTTNNQLSTESDDYTKPNRVLAGVAQLNSDWSSVFTTEARVLYKDYQSGQTPLLANTAMATVCTDHDTTGGYTVGSSATSCSANVPSVIVGPQSSSQANVLHVKTFGASLLARIALNDHRLRLLSEYQNVNNYNLFVNGANGTYYFDSVEAFQAGQAQTFSYTNATSLNPNDAAAKFTYQTYTFGIQDDWKVNSKLNVSYGMRYDMFGGHSTPFSNIYFFQREGFSNNAYINGKGLFQPRVGFDYAATRRFFLRGGAGIFGGGTPDVYVGNSFSASGVQPASYTTSLAGSPYLNDVSLTDTPAGIAALLKGSTTSSVSAIDPHFKVPSEWRATLSASYRANLGPLGDDWNFGADVLFTKTKDALLVQDVRNRAINGANALTPDGRQRYYDIVCDTPTTTTCADPNGDYLLTNTSKGRGYIAVIHFDKAWDMGVSVNGSFTYQNVKDQQAMTSSVASSNYNNGAYLDPNGGAYGHSNDEVKYTFKYDIAYDHAFFGDYKTRIDLFGQTRIGSPYSYTFQDPTSSGSNRSSVFGTVGSNSHYLFYVPTGLDDPRVSYDSPATAAAIDAIINGSGLKKYRGKTAPRNGFNSKWFTKLDLHVEQQIPTSLGGSRITVFADVENFLNLLNRNWGQQLRSFFPYNKQVAQVACVAQGTNSCAQYRYSGAATASSLADQLVTVNGSSLYTVRVGARFTF